MSAAVNKTINARPTKEFFIYMLTKDIKLIRSIIDLIDNSWDGATRIKEDVDANELWIRLEIGPDEFRISDNCGGISYEIAKDYAFRFGRPKEMPQTHHSVGQFGVGMKRSLFKLGKHFRIESKSPKSTFVVVQDVEKWVDAPEWEFEFESVKLFERKRPVTQCGTTITVTDLHESVRTDFASEIFISELKEAIELAHQRNIDQLVSITLNKVPLKAPIARLLQSSDLKSAHQMVSFDDETEAPVTVKIYVGVADSDPHSAGWSIFCNGRLILDADDSLVTGWGEGNGRVIPRYHNQYSRFRGYVFFDCDDASKLPWNTTKTGVDSDSRIYQAVRQRMVQMMRPVIDFLNRLDAEKELELKDRYLTKSIEAARQLKLESIPAAALFSAPAATLRRKTSGPKVRRIQYDKEDDKIEAVKKALGVTTLKEVGEGTFDYFFDLECE